MREKWIDFARGIAIYSVVLGHSIQYIYCHNESIEANLVFLFIYSFHMALFAMISGYLHYYFVYRYDFIDGIGRKVKTILIPCLAWGGIEYCYTLIRGWNKISVLGCVQYLISHNWFLWAVFYCGLVVIILKHFVRNTEFFWGGGTDNCFFIVLPGFS